jgi:hypothetical protein
MRKSLKASVLAVALSLGSQAAYALPSVTNAFVPGLNDFSDDSGELWLDIGTGGGQAAGNGLIDVGDILIGMIGVTSFPTSGVSAATVNEMTAIYSVEVATAVGGLPGAACGIAGGGGFTTCTSYTFKAPTVGFNASLGLANVGFGTTLPAYLDSMGGALLSSTIAVVLEDPSPDFDRTTASFDSAFNTAEDGAVRMTIGLGGVGNGFTALAPASPAVDFPKVGVGGAVGSIALNGTIETQSFPSWVFDPTILGSGAIRRGAGDPFVIWDDVTLTVDAKQIPEPSVLALLGLGLLGAGVLRRLRRS